MNYSWELSQFDTNLFGYKIAKVSAVSMDGDIPQNVKDLVGNLKEHEIKYALYRLQANAFPIIHELEKNNWLLVDGLIALNVFLDKIPSIQSNNHIRHAEQSDLTSIKQIALGVFSLTRFFNDSFVDHKKANELYGMWAENSMNGSQADEVLVWEENKTILGFITLQHKGHIPLIGVSKDAQGKGIAKALVQAALKQLKDKGVNEVEIETQLINIPALRAYENNGFKIKNSYLTYRWLNE